MTEQEEQTGDKEKEARRQISEHLEAARNMYSYLDYMGFGDKQDKEECTYVYWARWRQHDLVTGAVVRVEESQ